MLSLRSIRSIKVLNIPKILLACLTLFLIMVPGIASAGVHPCQNEALQLRGDLNVILNRGGLWALMEQTEGLQDKSMIGFQADGTLARAVGRFQSLCESEKKPTKQLFDNIGRVLGEATTIWNPRSTGEEIIKLIKKLNKKYVELSTKQ